MRFGPFELDLIPDRHWWLDGGTMFGIVPRALWERSVRTDERHRIRLACNCLLVRGEGLCMIVDAGLGDKWTGKERRIYRMDFDEDSLIDRMAALGVRPEDVTHVLLTHLHLDHAGWNTRVDGGALRPTFPNARYVVQKGEYDDARDTNEFTRGTYLPENLDPIDAADLWAFLEGDAEVAPGVRVTVSGGHTKHHQMVHVDGGAEGTAVFPGEILPTRHHRRLAWCESYDLFPLETLEAKRRLIAEATAAGHLLALTHDPDHPLGRLTDGGKGLVWEPLSAG